VCTCPDRGPCVYTAELKHRATTSCDALTHRGAIEPLQASMNGGASFQWRRSRFGGRRADFAPFGRPGLPSASFPHVSPRRYEAAPSGRVVVWSAPLAASGHVPKARLSRLLPARLAARSARAAERQTQRQVPLAGCDTRCNETRNHSVTLSGPTNGRLLTPSAESHVTAVLPGRLPCPPRTREGLSSARGGSRALWYSRPGGTRRPKSSNLY
jgi:hypothetical protein